MERFTETVNDWKSTVFLKRSILDIFQGSEYFSQTCYTAQETVDLVTFTEEILNEKLHFLCSVT